MKLFYSFLVTLFLLIGGCTHFDEPVTPNEDDGADITTRVVGGDDVINPTALRASAGIANVNNPYSKNNMRSAAALLAKYYGRPIKIPVATHYYVRFLPKDSVQLKTLTDKFQLELFDYPFDRELTDAQVKFYENDIVNGYSCWKYTLVPRLYWNFPEGIQKEIIDEACMLNTEYAAMSSSERNVETAAVNTTESEYDQIIDQAMKTAGITVPSSYATSGYTPSAVIKMQDDALNNQVIPLEGVKVRVNTFLNFGHGFTNKDGKVTISEGWGGKFKNPVRYKIQFESPYWVITNSWMFMAQIEGPTQDYPWDYTINSNNNSESAYASAHRALYYFYYKQSEISKPTPNPFRLEVHMSWNHQGLDCAGFVIPIVGTLPLVPDVVLYGKMNSTVYYTRNRIFSSTLHELGHISNFKHNLSTSLDAKMRESYGRAVQYYFLRANYPTVFNTIKPRYNSGSPNYTVIGESLFNQGFNLSQLTSTFLTSWTWDDWRYYCKNTNIAPACIIDLIFNEPSIAWIYNIQKEVIRSSNASFKAYINVPVSYTLEENFARFATSTKWATSDANATINTDDPDSTFVTFRNKGTYTVTCDVGMFNNSSFKTTRTIIVEDFPSVVGSKEPRVGVMSSYQMSDYIYFDSWQLGMYEEGNKFVSCNSDVIRATVQNVTINGALRQQFNVLALKHGEYVIRAKNIAAGSTLNVDFPITVFAENIEQTSSGWEAKLSICEVNVRKHITTGEVRLVIFNGDSFRIDSDYEDLPSGGIFMAFCRKPQKDHPYYYDRKEVFLYTNYGGTNGYAYSYGPILNLSGSNLPNTIGEGTMVLHLLRTEKPGTIPIYSIDVLTYDGTKLIGANRYLNTDNTPSGTVYNGTIRKVTTNYGIYGYAFPIR